MTRHPTPDILADILDRLSALERTVLSNAASIATWMKAIEDAIGALSSAIAQLDTERAQEEKDRFWDAQRIASLEKTVRHLDYTVANLQRLAQQQHGQEAGL